MPITPAQAARAEQDQLGAARDPAPQIRLIAGPGTGKSAAIERRVVHILDGNANPRHVYVISFTRASCTELAGRIAAFCAGHPCAPVVGQIRVSTMHSLALRILRSAAVLNTLYPADPTVLDDWERSHVYDAELASFLACSPGRAAEIRMAHDAEWQTLDPHSIAQAAITNTERTRFDVFHATRRNLYCFVLPGEVIYECVTRIHQGAIRPDQLPRIEHLIVDEFQDLNACDQEFIRRLTNNGATLFVAGDDDQSIYSFRHANPVGIVRFNETYPAAVTHPLTACFRCAPAILTPAQNLIAYNPDRLSKQLVSLYRDAVPPVPGVMHVWSFRSARDEAAAIAQSCQRLINNGLAGEEDQIVILISDRRLQLGPITQELGNLGLQYDAPSSQRTCDEKAIRAAYSILRLVRDQANNAPDYMAHRDLLAQLHGIGVGTSKTIGDLCVQSNQNFRTLFYLDAVPHWLNRRPQNAVERVRSVIRQIRGWTLQDSIGERSGEIRQLLSSLIFAGSPQKAALLREWIAFAQVLPQEMFLEEVLYYLSADDDVTQRQILDSVNVRLGNADTDGESRQNRIRILTMHGAKGLSGKIVFIPSAEQGIMPKFRAIQAAGLLNEQRRLFYVSITRAKAACIISHAALHTGAEAFYIRQNPQVRLPRSQFLNEMRVVSVNRAEGLTANEAAQIMTDIRNL